MGNTESSTRQQSELRTPKLNTIPARLPMPDHAELERRFTRVLVRSVPMYSIYSINNDRTIYKEIESYLLIKAIFYSLLLLKGT